MRQEEVVDANAEALDPNPEHVLTKVPWMTMDLTGQQASNFQVTGIAMHLESLCSRDPGGRNR